MLYLVDCQSSMHTSISEEVKLAWSEYRDKKMDLMNAAVVTDSAWQFARDMVKEVEADWLSTHTPARNDVQTLVGLSYNKNMADVADWCYVPTKVLLDAFANILHDNHQPVFKKGYFGTYDPKADRERMSVGQKLNEDKIILLSILPEFCMFDTFKFRTPTSDAITQGLVEFSKNRKVTLWLCFASQTFLNIHHIMRHSTLGAFGDLRMSGLRIQKEGDEEIQGNISTENPWIIQDAFLNLRVLSGLDKTGSWPEKHALLSQHSILCGLILFHLNIRMQRVGLQLVTQWYDVQQLAFLHNPVINYATRKDVRWPDMDAFIKIHGESHFFIGSRPQNAGESLNRLELATGISSAANFARDSRSKPFHEPDGKNPRLLKPTTAVANLFSPKYVEGLAEDAGIVNIDRILDELSQKSKLESSSCKGLNRANAELSITQKWSNTRNIDTIHLLAFLKTKLYEEEPVILYNYFGMHKRSVELQRLIREKEHHRFSFISNIVLLIHHVARGSAQNVRSMGLGSGDVELVSRIVISSGDVTREYLKKNGDVACKESRVFCKNKKPIQDEVADDAGESDGLVTSWLHLEDVLGPKGVASLMTGIPMA
ncbi:hypothetical protein BO83DRAFT_463447 [Aspergillus eucalypticola CBS 122712]|uniref:DUF6604 domain-containing protein n=1 Tax=Aspergillus eucalypticola (strain CBS 122712 / IBT 29274) TaxID=1448314 RepID=A0A317VV46_ASPEC|nr:uncharacterized protein BO83DRAFT_463447 [Aspergillus eucalypticola CBS 122712]PWY75760.1 hypothetical protein BO83DRAFT_463447 [Aspergillus eucalypticola CBS 122712]